MVKGLAGMDIRNQVMEEDQDMDLNDVAKFIEAMVDSW